MPLRYRRSPSDAWVKFVLPPTSLINASCPMCTTKGWRNRGEPNVFPVSASDELWALDKSVDLLHHRQLTVALSQQTSPSRPVVSAAAAGIDVSEWEVIWDERQGLIYLSVAGQSRKWFEIFGKYLPHHHSMKSCASRFLLFYCCWGFCLREISIPVFCNYFIVFH